MGALTLANLDPGQSTPRSKFYDSKVHWFRSHLSSSMLVRKVDAKEQLGDLFTKPLARDAFQCLRGQLMGWQERAKPVDFNASTSRARVK